MLSRVSAMQRRSVSLLARLDGEIAGIKEAGLW
jgi:hypothetical protein